MLGSLIGDPATIGWYKENEDLEHGEGIPEGQEVS